MYCIISSCQQWLLTWKCSWTLLNNASSRFWNRQPNLGVTKKNYCSRCWNNHIGNICDIAYASFFFRRQNHQISQQSIKANANTMLVWPQLEYAADACDLYTNAKKGQIEMTQRRTRYVCNDYYRKEEECVTAMVHQLCWEDANSRNAKTHGINSIIFGSSTT